MKTKIKLLGLLLCTVFACNKASAQSMVDSIPYTCGFENVVEQGFWRLANSSVNKWVIDTATSNGGTYSLYISNDNGETNAYTLTSASFNYAIRQLYIPAGLYEVSYDWRCYGEGTLDYMRAFLVPDTLNPTFTGGSNTNNIQPNNTPSGWIALDGGSKLNLSTSWRTYSDPILAIPASGNYHLVFFWRCDGVLGAVPAGAIDNVSITEVTCPRPMNLTATSAMPNTVTLSWATYGNSQTSWLVEYGPDGFQLGTGTRMAVNNATTATITSLPFGTTDFYVAAVCGSSDTSSWVLEKYTLCENNTIGAFDYANLTGPGVTCTYGTYRSYGSYDTVFAGPYANVGIIDYGPSAFGSRTSAGSRHTVHTTQFEQDPNAVDTILLTIPDGYCSSVRLGCAYGANICQSISYDVAVDTSQVNMLLINTALLLVNPGHSQNEQPRYLIELLDSAQNSLLTMVDIYAGQIANFFSWHNSSSSGGSPSQTDWAQLGVLLDQYHGMTVKLRFTTFNCGQGAAEHYGYAYYTVENQLVQIRSLNASATQFSMPKGFLYDWRQNGSQISTDRVVDVSAGANLSCTLTDVFGNTKTVGTTASPRTPHSDFTITVDSTVCNKRMVTLHNNSYLTINGQTRLNETESHVWLVDGGSQVCYLKSPTFEITPGQHTVSLVTSVGENSASDTMTQVVNVPDYEYVYNEVFDTIVEGESYILNGRSLTTTGVYTDTLRTANSCDTIVTLHLEVMAGESVNVAESLEEIAIYPNPAKNTLTVETSVAVEKLEVFDASGRFVAVVERNKIMDLSSLESGIYSLKITTSQGIVIKRFIKQ